jgi:hypothetical protein
METAEATPAATEAFLAEAEAVTKIETEADASTGNKTNKFYTEEDLARVRSQEKEKLYPQIDKLKEELETIKREKEAELERKTKEEAELSAKKEAEDKAKAEEELEVRDLLKVKEQEWQDQLERERQERERAFALLEREKAFAELQSYRQAKLEEERENIIPELVDLINGNTPEEINNSVENLKERSAKILESAQQALQTTRQQMTGTRVTTPPAGPLETNMDSRQFTAADIATMSMEDYAQNRQKLLSPTAQGKTKGLFG